MKVFSRKNTILANFDNFSNSEFYGKFATFSDFEKNQVFLQRIHGFFKKNFVLFEESYYFNRILQQFAIIFTVRIVERRSL